MNPVATIRCHCGFAPLVRRPAFQTVRGAVFLIAVATVLAGCTNPPKCKPLDLQRGMSSDDVIRLCGKPRHVFYSGVGDDVRERWIYVKSNSPYAATRLYFRHGKITDAEWDTQ